MTKDYPIIDAWVTKYALTSGIYKIRGRICNDVSEDMIKQLEPVSVSTYFHGKDWHRSKEEAVKHANEMVKKKVDSLKKQLKKYEEMKF